MVSFYDSCYIFNSLVKACIVHKNKKSNIQNSDNNLQYVAHTFKNKAEN